MRRGRERKSWGDFHCAPRVGLPQLLIEPSAQRRGTGGSSSDGPAALWAAPAVGAQSIAGRQGPSWHQESRADSLRLPRPHGTAPERQRSRRRPGFPSEPQTGVWSFLTP